MKSNLVQKCSVLLIFCNLIGVANIKAEEDALSNAVYGVNLEDSIGPARVGDLELYQGTVSKFKEERKDFVRRLIAILVSSKSSDFTRCAAAQYLGEMRASEAADALAANITLTLDINTLNIHGLPSPELVLAPQNALIKIGCPSIPAMLSNLKISGDPTTRRFSLEVLFRVEGDKDVVKLRLEKALKAERDPQKQARLQVALRELPDIK